ncbi:glycosyltransferase family 4 protein [Devosia sp. YIM 151766]|uniref:glycosyltransferase family 4 protein n=1 Tax=Devosia sp. YIM 151766 TaxID=3017325 RepID=UPI00255C6728|nr:glycosyltransferase family 4 protein [Devosia sp. YIM 151766]WIY51560.1 glycosyltransferase family 4 protein [Devosia sp. YIM 151766]
MKVTISAHGRAHMFALARQMLKRNSLGRIYSGFNWGSLKRENVPRDRVTTLPVLRPLMMLRYPAAIQPGPRDMQHMHRASALLQDALVSRRLPDTDIFVAQEGLGLWSGPAAQRHGARYVLDRGCTHIGWQHRLLREEYERVGLENSYYAPTTHERELTEYELADLIVVPSGLAKRSFVEAGVDAGRVAVVPYGVDLTRFRMEGRPGSGTFDLLFVGDLSVRKGAFDLFDALDLLASRAVTLTLIGSMEPAVRQRLGRRLRAGNVRVMGRVDHDRLRHVMSRSHVLVLPSIEDGFGLVVAEAMACGCPVILSENTGAREHVAHGAEGLVVPIRSPEAIAAAIAWMADNPAERAAMGYRARARVGALGGWDQYGERMFQLYSGLLQ